MEPKPFVGATLCGNSGRKEPAFHGWAGAWNADLVWKGELLLERERISDGSVISGPLLSRCSPTGTKAEGLTMPSIRGCTLMAPSAAELAGLNSLGIAGFCPWIAVLVAWFCNSTFSLASSFAKGYWGFESRLDSPFVTDLEEVGLMEDSSWLICLGSRELLFGHLMTRSCSDTRVMEFLQRPYFMWLKRWDFSLQVKGHWKHLYLNGFPGGLGM